MVTMRTLAPLLLAALVFASSWAVLEGAVAQPGQDKKDDSGKGGGPRDDGPGEQGTSGAQEQGNSGSPGQGRDPRGADDQAQGSGGGARRHEAGDSGQAHGNDDASGAAGKDAQGERGANGGNSGAQTGDAGNDPPGNAGARDASPGAGEGEHQDAGGDGDAPGREGKNDPSGRDGSSAIDDGPDATGPAASGSRDDTDGRPATDPRDQGPRHGRSDDAPNASNDDGDTSATDGGASGATGAGSERRRGPADDGPPRGQTPETATGGDATAPAHDDGRADPSAPGSRGEAPRRRPVVTETDAVRDTERGTSARPQEIGPTPAVTILDDATGFRTARRGPSDAPSIGYDAEAAALSLADDDDVARFTSRITGLLEHLDRNGDGAYDLGDEVLRHVPLDGIVPTIYIGYEDEATRDVVYPLPGGGTLTLIFHLGTSGQVGAKYDILVEGFPFLDTASRLAVGASAETQGGVQVIDVDGSPAVAGGGAQDVGYLSWVTHATVDQADVPVGWSVHLSRTETSESAMIYWSYPQGARILHDPQVGFIDLPPELLGDAELFVYGLVATGTVLLIGHELRRRRTW